MSLSPQRIRETEFKSAKRGFEQDEVRAFQQEVADALEAAQNEATAMEARARAAVARLQELSAQGGSEPAATPAPEPAATVQSSVDDAETISRTLLLAQRTADQAIAEARAEADRLLSAARDGAASQLDEARAEAARVIEEGRVEARRAGEADKARVEGEVQALLARRDFLESDVEHLDQFLVAQRERITEAAAQLSDMVQRIPGGLADMRRPLLSAAADESAGSAGTSQTATTAASTEASADASPADEDVADATGDVWALRSDDAAVAAAEAEAAATADADAEDDDPGADATPSAASSLFDDVDRPR
jgi:DivIVA domain-containing protein